MRESRHCFVRVSSISLKAAFRTSVGLANLVGNGVDKDAVMCKASGVTVMLGE